MFADYQGYLQADAYDGYDGVCKKTEITRCGCMAHCRRKFFEATMASTRGVGLANEAIEIIRKLYEVKETIRDKDVEERHQIRMEKSKPILDEFRQWLNKHLGKVPPQCNLVRH